MRAISMTSTPPAADETQFVADLQAGRDQAYAQLVQDHGGRVLAVTRRILGNEEDANDATQDAFLQAFKAIGKFEGQSKLSTWLHRIAVNAALMKLRTKRRHPEISIEQLLPSFKQDGHATDVVPGWGATADQELLVLENRELVRRIIDQLPDDYRDVLLLRDIEELDTQETADTLGISNGAVKTRLHRARQALRTLLDPHVRGDAA
jgi:RNA polymerase sigma-70 factor (ECF subfamily)